MVPNILLVGHFNLIIRHLLLGVGNDVVALQLQPSLLPLIKQDAISKMKRADIKGAVGVIHPAFVNQNLLQQLAVLPVVVEFDGLDELGLVVRICLVRLDHWHVALLCLDDVHRQVSQIFLLISRLQETLDLNYLFVVAVRVLCLEEFPRQVKVGAPRIDNLHRALVESLMVLHHVRLRCVIRRLNGLENFR